MLAGGTLHSQMGGRPHNRNGRSFTPERKTGPTSSRIISPSITTPVSLLGRQIVRHFCGMAMIWSTTSRQERFHTSRSISLSVVSRSTPSFTDVVSGDIHIAELLERLHKSPQWER